jgi:hypothetical protein
LNSGQLHRAAVALSLGLVLAILWSLTHRYEGLGGDAELYAFQALAQIHPALAGDLYLSNVSQAQYTIFSPLYSYCIGLFGLENAALALTIMLKVWFFAAAWTLARALAGSRTAFLSIVLLITAVSSYGAYGVFHYSEDWVTARSLAEALVITALALHFRGSRTTALLIALMALLIHPLMGLPGFLFLLCLRLPVRIGVFGAIAGILASLAIALAASLQPSSAHLLAVIDADWLEIVRERSQFLFLQFWSVHDWTLNARPFLSVIITAIVLRDAQIRRVCAAAALVGAAGLGVALIASLLGPVAVLLQGQAWRWMWVTAFVSVLLSAPTILQVWRDERCGPLCALLIVAGWATSALAGAVCMTLALIVWSLREHIALRAALGLRWTAAACGAGIVAWSIADSWPITALSLAEPGHEPLPGWLLRGIVGFKILAVPVMFLFSHWIRASRLAAAAATSAVLFVASALILPKAFAIAGGGAAEFDEFSDWRNVIPETDTVLVLPPRNSAKFAWFTLQRPSYLSVNQSAGVIFSRATALEVRRRAEVMLPVSDPDWRLFSNMRKARGGAPNPPVPSHPLTGTSLISLCADPRLNFVVARENVGFDPIRHTHSGIWKGWNLYDCRRVHP